MTKRILITGATDGIGLETARCLAADGHTLLLHGRNAEKLAAVQAELTAGSAAKELLTFQSDLSDLSAVVELAIAVRAQVGQLDVLINNAGVYKLAGDTSVNGLDVRFVVNTLAPYILTRDLLPLMSPEGRIVNLSSAAQSPVDLSALAGSRALGDGEAYAQSKLALTMWTIHMAQTHGADGPVLVAVNPASFLGSKMVKEAYGTAGHDLGIGADILVRAALDDEFAQASGRYYDNDRKCFADPHPDALDPHKNQALVETINTLLAAQQH